MVGLRSKTRLSGTSSPSIPPVKPSKRQANYSKFANSWNLMDLMSRDDTKRIKEICRNTNYCKASIIINQYSQTLPYSSIHIPSYRDVIVINIFLWHGSGTKEKWSRTTPDKACYYCPSHFCRPSLPIDTPNTITFLDHLDEQTQQEFRLSK